MEFSFDIFFNFVKIELQTSDNFLLCNPQFHGSLSVKRPREGCVHCWVMECYPSVGRALGYIPGTGDRESVSINFPQQLMVGGDFR